MLRNMFDSAGFRSSRAEHNCADPDNPGTVARLVEVELQTA